MNTNNKLMIYKVLGTVIIGLYLFTQIRWTLWLFDKKPVSFKKILITAILTTTVGAYIISMFIVDLDKDQQSIFSYQFSFEMDIALYVYLALLVVIVIVDIIKLNHIKDEETKPIVEKQFLMLTFTKMISIVLIMAYIVLMAL